MARTQPTSVVLFTYQVGFGDCFLLRFSYPSGDKHVLIDFGSTAGPRAGSTMLSVAEHIKQTCDGKLDAIVVTHRHADHISGFAGETWRVIRALDPKLVLLPWTEDPDAAKDAARSTRKSAPGVPSMAKHIRALAAMHEVAQATLDEIEAKGDIAELRRGGAAAADGDDDGDEDWTATTRPFSKAVTKQLAFLGEENLKNAAAVKNLMTLPREFLSFGDETALEKLLPGVKVRVLGPPTLEQSSAISQERATDPDEFWHVTAQAVGQSAAPQVAPPFPNVKTVPVGQQPVEVRWFTKRLDAARGEELLELVRILDSAMNNTSLILLFEVGKKKLLFPGDAQIENWSYALSKPAIRRLLADVDVYKVGHHGSLNATPKSLWALFKKKGASRRLKTFLSTRTGKHGSAQRGTEVPRAKLMKELEEHSRLFTTQLLTRKDEIVMEQRVVP